jgi:hypothetical protein
MDAQRRGGALPVSFCSALLLISVLSSSAFCGQAPKGFSEVPKDKLDGLKLVLAEANCSLTAPGAEWKWLTSDAAKGREYLCFNTKTGAGCALSVGKLANEIDAHTREQVANGARQAATASGAKVGNEKYEPAQIPLPGKSWRLYYEVAFKDGAKAGVVFYLVQTAEHVLVTLQESTVTPADSKPFAQFVASLKPLK